MKKEIPDDVSNKGTRNKGHSSVRWDSRFDCCSLPTCRGPRTRSIRWVVPWPAGGVADTQARIIADQLGKALGQQVMIDDLVGASGVLGADAGAKSKPDRYTLLYVSPNEHAIAQAIGMVINYDAAKAFTPITQFLRRPAVYVNAALNLRTRCRTGGAGQGEGRRESSTEKMRFRR